MDILTPILILAAALGVGITFGARLARSELDFLPSLWLQIAMFATLCLTWVYFPDRPLMCAAISCVLVSTSMFWLGRRTAPDKATTTSYLGYSAPEASTPVGHNKPAAHRKSGNVITPAPSTWIRPFGRRRPTNPVRTTPTGKTIRLATSIDTIPPGKRGTGKLTAVK
ncbi:MAG: hypothetical protein SGJ27_26890 [Candidatus Melainabacteria bacterium]|nr:hypothetical protein [Candidatus Melainabacteria bacterium]